jgi:hypothetical protein
MAIKKKARKKAKPRKVKFPNVTVSSKDIFSLASKSLAPHLRPKMVALLFDALPLRSKVLILKAKLKKMNQGSRDRLIAKFCTNKK